MSTPFSEIHLTKSEVRALKMLKIKKPISDASMKTLSTFGFVSKTVTEWQRGRPTAERSSISEYGVRYLEYHRREIVSRRLPIILTVISILISLMVLFLQLQEHGYIPAIPSEHEEAPITTEPPFPELECIDL